MDINDIEQIERLPQEVLDRLAKNNYKTNRYNIGSNRKRYTIKLPKKYRSYMMSANRRQLGFFLTVEEFEHICSHACVYCGSRSRVGVDRRDSSCGYTIDNSQPCCTECNMMKFRYDEEDFLQQVLKIYRHRLVS